MVCSPQTCKKIRIQTVIIRPKQKDQQKQNLVNKEERRKKIKSMTSQQRKELIIKKMNEKGIEIGSGVPDKKYDSEEIYELIHIANCFSELREKGKNNKTQT